MLVQKYSKFGRLLQKTPVFVNWYISTYFLLSPTPLPSPAYFGPLSRRHPYSPNVNHCVSTISPQRSLRGQNKIGSLSLVEHLVELELGTFQFFYRLTWLTPAIQWMVNLIECVMLWAILQNLISFFLWSWNKQKRWVETARV